MPSDSQPNKSYFVCSEDGDCFVSEAATSQAAVDEALKNWGLVADEGYSFYVFSLDDAERFAFKLRAEPVA